MWSHWRYYGGMPSIQIKHVPEHTHAALRQRAAHQHQSLQEYLLAMLINETSRPTLEEVLDDVSGHAGGAISLSEAVEILKDERAGH